MPIKQEEGGTKGDNLCAGVMDNMWAGKKK